jgi:hypothetical protein
VAAAGISVAIGGSVGIGVAVGGVVGAAVGAAGVAAGAQAAISSDRMTSRLAKRKCFTDFSFLNYSERFDSALAAVRTGLL